MKMNLLELLKSKPISHPTKIESVQLNANAVHVVVTGSPWWKTDGVSEEGSIEFLFEDVSEGTFDVSLLNDSRSWKDEALEDFEVQPLTDVEWAQPHNHTIYCGAALREPYLIYSIVHDYLAQAGSYLRAEAFLNSAYSLRKFVEITSSSSFMLASGPEIIRRLIADELARQDVPYKLISHDLPPDSRLWVKFGRADFLCRSAFAGFD